MEHVFGVLAEGMISDSKIEDISLILSDLDISLYFINEINNVAEYIAIDKEGILKNTEWVWFKLNGEPGMVYAPEFDTDDNIIANTPDSLTYSGKENPSYIVMPPKTFGLICTIIATANVLVHLKEKRERHLGSDKKMLGLINRRLDRNIEFFSELHANIHSSLNKILEFISTKNPNGDTHAIFTSNDISLLLNDYSALMAGNINMQKKYT